MEHQNIVNPLAEDQSPCERVFEVKRQYDRLLRSPPDISGERLGSVVLLLGLLAGLVAVYAHIIAIASRVRLSVEQGVPWIVHAPLAPNLSDYGNSSVGIVVMLGCVWLGLRSRRAANALVIVAWMVFAVLGAAIIVVTRSVPNLWLMLASGAIGVLGHRVIELPKPPTRETDTATAGLIAEEVKAIGAMRLHLHNAGFLAACAFMGACASIVIGVMVTDRPWSARLGDEMLSVEVLHRDPEGYIVKRGPTHLEWIAVPDVARLSAP